MTSTPPQPPARSWTGGWIVLLLGVTAVAIATLGPAETGDEGWSTCLVCGSRGIADVIVNFALFLPIGVGVGLLSGRISPAGAAALVLSLVVELAQQAIPGRDPSLRDLVCNSLGGLTGGALVPFALWALRIPAPLAARFSLLFATIAAMVVAVTGVLTRPSLTDSAYFGQWTPRLGHLESYRGEIVEAAVGGEPIGRRRIDERLVRERFLAGEPLEIVLRAGPPPLRLAPIFSVFDRQRREILLIGAEGPDLVLHLRTRSRDLRLDQPDLRLWGGLAGAAAGDTLRLSVTWREGAFCATVDGEGGCRLGVTAGSGWALLYALQSSPRGVREWLGRGWLALLFLPFGAMMVRRVATGVGAVIGVLALGAVPGWVGLLPTPPGEWTAAGVGAGLGLAIAWRWARRSPSVTPPARSR